MVRPRWHDALIVFAIVGLLLAGVWSLWWDDVRTVFHLGPDSPVDPPIVAAPTAHAQT
jgi:hypothetical protein